MHHKLEMVVDIYVTDIMFWAVVEILDEVINFNKGGCMKRVVALTLGLFLVAGVAQAASVDTSTDFWHHHTVDIPTPAEATIDTNTQRQDWGAGVGLDVTVLRPNWALLDTVSLENRYDVKNREYRGYVVASVDLTR